MDNIRVISEIPKVEEYKSLRESIGWRVVEDSILEKGLKNSVYCVSVKEKDKLIGFGRIVGDDATVFYIQDIMVNPTYQKHKIGTMIMKNIVEYINKNVDPKVIVALIAKKDLSGFYEKFNFKSNENDLFFRYEIK